MSYTVFKLRHTTFYVIFTRCLCVSATFRMCSFNLFSFQISFFFSVDFFPPHLLVGVKGRVSIFLHPANLYASRKSLCIPQISLHPAIIAHIGSFQISYIMLLDSTVRRHTFYMISKPFVLSVSSKIDRTQHVSNNGGRATFQMGDITS